MTRHSQFTLAFSFVVAATTLILSPTTSEARSFRLDQIPNGSAFGCETCHSPETTRIRNAFGQQVESTLVAGDVDWDAIFDLDADGDGVSNGEELGDPDGTWSIGDDDPDVEVTSPAIADEFAECEEDADCDDGDVCDDGECVEGDEPACVTDADCNEDGEDDNICVEGVCEEEDDDDEECDDDGDCDDGFTCEDFECVEDGGGNTSTGGTSDNNGTSTGGTSDNNGTSTGGTSDNNGTSAGGTTGGSSSTGGNTATNSGDSGGDSGGCAVAPGQHQPLAPVALGLLFGLFFVARRKQ